MYISSCFAALLFAGARNGQSPSCHLCGMWRKRLTWGKNTKPAPTTQLETR